MGKKAEARTNPPFYGFICCAAVALTGNAKKKTLKGGIEMRDAGWSWQLIATAARVAGPR
jgi:hypothetical protein